MTKFPIKLSKNSASFLVMSCNGNGIQLFEYPWELIQKFCHSCDKTIIEKSQSKGSKIRTLKQIWSKNPIENGNQF